MTSCLTTSAQRSAFRDVKRACYAGLDSIALRTELARRVAPVVPMDGHSFAITDPDTGLLTSGLMENLPSSLMRSYIDQLYPYEAAAGSVDLARAGRTVVSFVSMSEEFRVILGECGLGHEINLLASDGQSLWGSWCLLREQKGKPFSERENSFLSAIAPHVARGLKASALLDTARCESAPLEGDAASPGVVVLDRCGRVSMRNPAATAHLDDLADVGTEEGEVPLALASVLVQLRRPLHLASDDDPQAAADATLHARGRSGQWYALRGSLSEPNSAGESSIIVLIAPVEGRDRAMILTRLYGLTPREREVLGLLLQGNSTKRIAAQLALSPYTVQNHLDHACDKVGVRGRKALIARLFFDGYAPSLA